MPVRRDPMSKTKHLKFDAPFADAEEAEIIRAVEGWEFTEGDVTSPRQEGMADRRSGDFAQEADYHQDSRAGHCCDKSLGIRARHSLSDAGRFGLASFRPRHIARGHLIGLLARWLTTGYLSPIG
jgi:hypothetical protein